MPMVVLGCIIAIVDLVWPRQPHKSIYSLAFYQILGSVTDFPLRFSQGLACREGSHFDNVGGCQM